MTAKAREHARHPHAPSARLLACNRSSPKTGSLALSSNGPLCPLGEGVSAKYPEGGRGQEAGGGGVGGGSDYSSPDRVKWQSVCSVEATKRRQWKRACGSCEGSRNSTLPAMPIRDVVQRCNRCVGASAQPRAFHVPRELLRCPFRQSRHAVL